MEEILKILQNQNEGNKREQQFENLIILFIALVVKRVNIKNISEQNYNEVLSENEYASFWKKIKEVYFDKKIKEKNQIKNILKKAIEIQKNDEEKIASTLIYLIDFSNEKEKENINKLITKIIDLNSNSKVADVFGKKGFLSLELIQKNNCVVDYYETDINNILRALIRFSVFNEMSNIVESLPGVLKKTKYDFVFANPETEIKLLTPGQDNNITDYESIKMLIDEENIYPFKISNDMSSYFFISLIIISMLKKEGKAMITVPVDVLSNSANRGIRKYLAENYLEEIIILPDHIYPYMQLDEENTKFALLIFKKDKHNNEIKYINLEYCYFPKEKYNEIDIEKASEQYKNYKKITREKIQKNNYSFNSEQYIKDVEVDNAVFLDEITTDIFRGYQFGKEELKKMISKNDEEINYRILKNKDEKTEKTVGINSKNKNLDRYLLKCGDIIINARGEENSINILTKSIEEAKYIATGSTIVIRPDEEKINGKYLALFLENKKGNILLNKIKNKNALYVGNLKKLKIACPEKSLQEKTIKKIIQLEKELSDIKNSI